MCSFKYTVSRIEEIRGLARVGLLFESILLPCGELFEFWLRSHILE